MEFEESNSIKKDKKLNTNIKKGINLENLKNYIMNYFDRKTLYKFLKHFKYYDNGTEIITKLDFSKVIKNFRISLSPMDIEKIFEDNANDSKKNTLCFRKFLDKMVNIGFSPERKNAIEEIYYKIGELAEKTQRQVDLNFIKLYYN